jgi:hypothetical protein
MIPNTRLDGSRNSNLTSSINQLTRISLTHLSFDTCYRFWFYQSTISRGSYRIVFGFLSYGCAQLVTQIHNFGIFSFEIHLIRQSFLLKVMDSIASALELIPQRKRRGH